MTVLRPMGKHEDATRRVRLEVADRAIARVDGSLVTGLADGHTELIVQLGATEKRVPLARDGCRDVSARSLWQRHRAAVFQIALQFQRLSRQAVGAERL